MRLKEKDSIDQQLPHYSKESKKKVESFSFFPLQIGGWICSDFKWKQKHELFYCVHKM